jgi:Tfp pilus assembly protein PilF
LPSQFHHQSSTRARAGAAVGLLVCGWLFWHAGRAGISSLLSDYAMRSGMLIAADRAISFAPSDPTARYARAAVLLSAGDPAEAAQEYERAVAARPQDYALWLELGQARDQANDVEEAISAFGEAARLAPYYSQPRWQLGNMLLRAGRYDEAFNEMRRAAASAPSLLPNMIDLAYGLYNGEAGAIEQVVQAGTPAARLALARIFARNGNAGEVLRLVRASRNIPEQERQSLVTDLLAAKQFPEAFEIWASGRTAGPRSGRPEGAREDSGIGQRANPQGGGVEAGKARERGDLAFVDGGFEEKIQTNSDGFGWQVWRALQGIHVSVNAKAPHTGLRSLLVDWRGDLQTPTPIVSQLVLVEPKRRYRLSFWSRAEELVTGGPPVVTVTDAGDGHFFSQSAPTTQGAGDWRRFSVDFETTADTRAVLIAIRRQGCVDSPCPIFGRTWFDDFMLTPDHER